MAKQNFKFGNVQGDVIGAGASGIIAKTISGTVNINAQTLEKMPTEYSASLQAFQEQLNALLQKYQVNQEQAAPVEQAVQEFAEEAATVEADQQTDYVKKTNLKTRLVNAAAGLTKFIPKGAEIAAAFTPLAPFSKIIGEAVETVISNVVKN